jgi:hypothetical protein
VASSPRGQVRCQDGPGPCISNLIEILRKALHSWDNQLSGEGLGVRGKKQCR